MYKTYKIIFLLNSPISFLDTPTFDGVLSYAYAREILPDAAFSQKLNIDKSEIIDFSNMPIEIHEKGYFMASKMFFDETNGVESIQKWRKRWANKYDNIADFGKQQRKVDVARGAFKSYDMPIIVKHIPVVWFYFKTDNIYEVKRLVSKHIHFLGKKRAQGYGEILKFEIEQSNYEFVGAFRPIPLRLADVDINKFEDVKFTHCAWKPPYWMPENFDMCAI